MAEEKPSLRNQEEPKILFDADREEFARLVRARGYFCLEGRCWVIGNKLPTNSCEEICSNYEALINMGQFAYSPVN